MKRTLTAQRRLVYLFTLITEFSSFLLIFTVSRALAEGGVTLTTMGVVGGGLSVWIGGSSIISGRCADRFGRRRLMAMGTVVLFVAAAGLIGCREIGSEGPLYFSIYWLAGLAMGMVYPSSYAWLSASAELEAQQHVRGVGRTIIVFALMWNLGLVSGQIVGGWSFRWLSELPLYIAGGLALLNLILLTHVESAPQCEKALSTEVESEELRQKRKFAGSFVKLAWLSNLGGAFSMSMVIHLFPKLAVHLGVPSEQHGMILAVTRGVVISVYFGLYFTHFWHLRLVPAVVSQLLAVIGLLLISYSSGVASLMLGLVFLAQLLGFNYFASLYYATLATTHERRGTASGIHEATLALGFAAGSFLGGIVGDVGGLQMPYRLGAAVIVALVLLQVMIYWRQIRNAKVARTLRVP